MTDHETPEKPPLEWLEGLDVVTLDSEMVRALAHPMRNRILASLRLTGPATSAMLAERLNTNTGQTSYHLRALDEVGLVVEDPDQGTGRERWWKSAHKGTSWSETAFTDDPEDHHAADWLTRYHNRTNFNRVDAYLDEREEWSEEWQEAAYIGDNWLATTPERLRELNEKIDELIETYREEGKSLDPETTELVTFIRYAFPSTFYQWRP
ncbi:MAG: helix-turn-helix domain-containing protein [Acidimicrobiia bacterium]|nr:helix-turn-helix domain-containing protein [Acidimicrobiia bacterium]